MPEFVHTSVQYQSPADWIAYSTYMWHAYTIGCFSLAFAYDTWGLNASFLSENSIYDIIFDGLQVDLS